MEEEIEVEGGEDFEVLPPPKRVKKETLSSEDYRELKHAIGVPNTGYIIPGTKIEKDRGEKIYELPKHNREKSGAVRKVFAVKKRGKTPKVYKIDRRGIDYTQPDYVRRKKAILEETNKILNRGEKKRSAENLGGIWLENLNFKGHNRNKLWIPKCEWIADKNLSEIGIPNNDEGKEKLKKMSKGVAEITGELFENNLVLDDLKPQDFCPGEDDQPVLVDEENVRYRETFGKKESEKIGKALARFTKEMANQHRHAIDKRTIKEMRKEMMNGIREKVSRKREKDVMLKEFDNQLSYILKGGERLEDFE